jgi:hypothetical protein
VPLKVVRLLAASPSHERALKCRESGYLEATNLLVEALRVLIEALKVLEEAMRVLVKAVRVLVEVECLESASP